MLKLSAKVQEKLEIYKKLLFKWQKSINLVSNGSLPDFWNRHVVDSYQLIPYVRGRTVLDVGAGGGFPGMILAIAGGFDVTCVDSDSRKMIFLSEVARLTQTKVKIVTSRVEQMPEGKFDTICARGFADLSALLSIMLTRGQYGVFLKGKKVIHEISEAEKEFAFSYDLHPSISDGGGSILTVDLKNRRA